MATARCFILALLVAAAAPVQAADEHRCLDPDQRRAAIAGRRAVPLVKAMRAAKSRLGGEIVNARLCEYGEDLVYVLTVLARDGKVMRASIDGASGAFLHVR